jgi:hypothetical protein
VHFVRVAADFLGQPLEPVDKSIGAVVERVADGPQLLVCAKVA